MSKAKRKKKRVVISFDSHTPYLAFRVSSLIRKLEAEGLAGDLDFHIVLLGAEEKSYGWEGGNLDALYGGAKVHILTDEFHGLGMRPYLSRKAMVTTWRYVKKLISLRPKVIFAGGYDRPASFAGALLSYIMRFKIGVLWDSRFNDAESFSKRVGLERIKAFMIRRYDFFMCSGKECAEYTRFLAGPKKPVWTRAWDVVDNDAIARHAGEAAADEEVLEILGLPDGTEFFFAPHRFLPKKNTAVLLEAYAAYRESALAAGHKPACLLLSGKGPLRESIGEKVRRDGLSELVRIVDWIPYHRIPRVFRLSRALVLPSRFDQWGMTVNEALAAGTAALVSNRCGAHELVKNNVNGFTFDPGDSPHLAQLLFAVGHDDELHARLRANAADSMKEFSIEQFNEAYIDALEQFKVIDRSTLQTNTADEHPAPAHAL